VAAALGLLVLSASAADGKTRKERDAAQVSKALDESSAALAAGDARLALKSYERIADKGAALTDFKDERLQLLAAARSRLAATPEADPQADPTRILICRLRDSLGREAPPAGSRILHAEANEGGIQAPERLYAPNPQYSALARRMRVEGVVISQVVISTEGCVVGYRRLKGLHPDLDEDTQRALLTWVFRPARVGGEPVIVYWNLTTHFDLQ
jgi:hypothetical protein